MNRKDFIRKVTANLRDNNLRKPIRSPRHVFHISDDEGNSKDFIIKANQREYIYTEEDVERFVTAALDVIVDALKDGDNVNFSGYGSIGLKYRKGRHVRNDLVNKGEYLFLPGHNVPKLFAGKQLKIAAKIFDMKTDEANQQIEYRYDDIAPTDE